MLKKYRRQFVTLTLSLVGIVLLTIFTLIGVYMYRNYTGSLEATMQELLKPLRPDTMTGLWEPDSPYGGMRAMNQSDAPAMPAGREDDFAAELSLDSESSKEFNTMFLDTRTGSYVLLSEDALLDDEELSRAVGDIYAIGNGFGTLQDYGIIYCSEYDGQFLKIAIVKQEYIRSFALNLVITLTGVFLLAMLVFLLVSRKISKLAVKPLEEAMTREKQFVADVSHDLKTPITIILANSSILKDNPESSVSGQMKWIDSTAAAAENMQGLVNSMLTLSSIDSPEFKLKTEALDFTDLAERCALQLESVAYDAGIILDTELEENIILSADRDCLGRVCESLIENAIKYAPADSTVSVGLKSEKGWAVFSVENKGTPIPEEELEHVFDRFYRADKTRNSKGGHGLGLAIAKEMTELMGGSIYAESAGDRTCFGIRFKKA